MEFVIAAAAILGLVVLLRLLRARHIARGHAITLSRVTGVPVDQIRREIINGNQTPGEWAARHGLDPWTFQPRGPTGVRDFGSSTNARSGIHPATGGGTAPGLNAERDPDESAVKRLRDMGDAPLSSWTTCPVCMNPLAQAVPDVKACVVCFRAYTDGGVAPIAHNQRDTVAISGTEPYFPTLLAELARAKHPKLVWMIRPPGFPSTLPPMLPDEEFEDRAFAS